MKSQNNLSVFTLLVSFILVFLLLDLSSCKSDDDRDEAPVSCLPDFEEDNSGQWLIGDFHVHATGASNDTGGDSDPLSIKNKAIERGLDFVVLTDHSNSTGSDATTTEEDPALFNMGPEFPLWETAASLSEENVFLMIDGNELSPRAEDNGTKTGHIGCIPRSLNNFDTDSPFIDRPMGTVNGQQTIMQARNRGCFVVLNHPFNLFPWIAFDWTSFDYDAIEVWNGTQAYDQWDEQSRDAWICDLLSGKKVAAIGGSDNHRVNIEPPGSPANPPLAFPSTAVFAKSFSWPAIIEALEEGRTMIFEGDSRLILNSHDEEGCLTVASDTYWIRVQGITDSNLVNPVMKLSRSKSCTDTRTLDGNAPLIEKDILLEEELVAGESFEFRYEVKRTAGVYSAILKGEGDHYLALSGAIVVE